MAVDGVVTVVLVEVEAVPLVVELVSDVVVELVVVVEVVVVAVVLVEIVVLVEVSFQFFSWIITSK